MTDNDRDWQALADVVRERRLALRLNQGDLERYGGPSEGTVRNIERHARKKYTPRTYQQLETVLRFPRGTLEGVLDGKVKKGGPELSQMVAGERPAAATMAAQSGLTVGGDSRVTTPIDDGKNRLYGLGQWAPRPAPVSDVAGEEGDEEERARIQTALARMRERMKVTGILRDAITAISELDAPMQRDLEAIALIERAMEVVAGARNFPAPNDPAGTDDD